jgi:hypothetical protein
VGLIRTRLQRHHRMMVLPPSPCICSSATGCYQAACFSQPASHSQTPSKQCLLVHLRLQVSITRATPEEQVQLRGLLAGTLLEGCVKFGRLSYSQMLRDLCIKHTVRQPATLERGLSWAHDADFDSIVVDARDDLAEQGQASSPFAASTAAPSCRAPKEGGCSSVDNAMGPSRVRPCVVLALFFCGHSGIAAQLEKAVEKIGHETAGQPGAPLVMYGSETVFG